MIALRKSPDPDHRAFASTKSWETSGAKPEAIDAEAFGRWFAPVFATWLREEFKRSEHAAVELGVSVNTIDNWKSQTAFPNGRAVGLFFLRYPDAVAWYMSQVAE